MFHFFILYFLKQKEKSFIQSGLRSFIENGMATYINQTERELGQSGIAYLFTASAI